VPWGIDVSLQPFVNIDRDLEYGRGYNTFGEDPFLTGEVGAAEIKGIQSQHVMAQVKHFVGYDSDNENTWIDGQTLHEVYVAHLTTADDSSMARRGSRGVAWRLEVMERIQRDSLGTDTLYQLSGNFLREKTNESITTTE